MYLIVRIFLTIITYTLWLIISIICSLIAVPLSFLPEKIRNKHPLYFSVMSLTSRLLLKSMFIPIRYINQKSLSTALDEPSIVIANHTSSIDIPILDGLMHSSPRFWIGNEKFGKIPMLGILLRRMNIPIAPTKPKQSIRALEQALKKAQQTNKHILMFPEGTRHEDGNIHPFKQGFARLAEKLNRPVIPVLIERAHHVFPKSAHIIHWPDQPITVLIGPPMKPHSEENSKDFIDRIERWFKLNRGTL